MSSSSLGGASSSTAAPPGDGAPVQIAEPIGNGPHIVVALLPAPAQAAGALARLPPGGFLVSLSKTAPLAFLRVVIADKLGVPTEAVTLMHGGKDVEDGLTMEENGVTLPGPAARRMGSKPELLFGLLWDSLRRQEEKVEAEVREAERQARNLQRQKEQEEERQKRLREDEVAKLRHEEWMRSNAPLEEVDRYVQNKIGGILEEPIPGQPSEPPPHTLEICGEEIRVAAQTLMRATAAGGMGAMRGYGGGAGQDFEVIRVFRNRNPVLLERFERTRADVKQARDMRPRAPATLKAVRQDPRAYQCLFQNLGDLEAAANEAPMWHGTHTAEAAGGICRIGFDIAFAGTATGSVYSPGFYFADCSGTSHGYTRQPWSVNTKYNSLHVMLLSRVVLGNIHDLAHAPTEQEKETLTGRCFAAGGTFGANSEFHSLLGGGWAHVCMHRDQVYPEYVLIYKT